MKSILWFRRDLRISDNEMLFFAKGEVLPIFIYDTNLLDKDDKRITFIYKSVLGLKEKLKSIGLDLAIFHGKAIEILKDLKTKGFDEVLYSIEYEPYAIKRDKEVEKILHVRRFHDSFLLNPRENLKKDNTPYKVFTPFYNSLAPIWQSNHIEEFIPNNSLTLSKFDYDKYPSLREIGFIKQKLPAFLYKDANTLVKEFKNKLYMYKTERDYFSKDASSNLSVHLRFGLISAKEIFNALRDESHSEYFIRSLFWREFYNCILYHFPKSQNENFNAYKVKWENDKDDFQKWCEGKTGYPIIDAAMIYLNQTGLMHNRLRMIVASFLTKNLLVDWRWGEEYFAKKLLDYEASTNIGSWQWAASTGADSVPYFRIFNPCTQSEKFDKEAVFIKSILKNLKDVEPKLLHIETALHENNFPNYPKPIISIANSRARAIATFKRARNERD